SGRKETVLDLAKFVDKGVQVKLTGGRQVTGTLKGYDQLLNLVLDEAVEFLRAKACTYRKESQHRLGQ
ncbi:LSM domain, eukaryotic/archaea-type, partial [Dillenia turbinata]